MSSTVLVLLAGGKSTRMGSPKGLLDYFGTPWIVEQISRYTHFDSSKVYIGLGYDYKKYFKAIPWFKRAIDNFYRYNGVDVRVIINKQPEYGAFSTVQAVLSAIDTESTVVILPIDVPLLNKENLKLIIDCNATIAIPVCNDRNGHPVKLNPIFWNRLLSMDVRSNEARLDTLIKKENNSSVTYIKVSDNSVYQNINTIKNWNKYLSLNQVKGLK